MIDAHTIERAVCDPIENSAVSGLEDVQTLNAHANERVDIKETAIGEVLIGGSPVGKPIVLEVQQFVQSIVVSVELIRDACDGFCNFSVLRTKPAQQLVDHGLVTMPRLNRLVI